MITEIPSQLFHGTTEQYFNENEKYVFGYNLTTLENCATYALQYSKNHNETPLIICVDNPIELGVYPVKDFYSLNGMMDRNHPNIFLIDNEFYQNSKTSSKFLSRILDSIDPKKSKKILSELFGNSKMEYYTK